MTGQPRSALRANDPHTWVETIWQALGKYRDACIPEGSSKHDEAWDDLCTAMAWIAEALELNSAGGD